jgi:hypothetical protein
MLGDLRLGLSRLPPQELVEALELGTQPRGMHPGWHRRHLLAARELEAKPLEGALDSLKLAPDRGRFPTLREEADQVARLTFQPKDFAFRFSTPRLRSRKVASTCVLTSSVRVETIGGVIAARKRASTAASRRCRW